MIYQTYYHRTKLINCKLRLIGLTMFKKQAEKQNEETTCQLWVFTTEKRFQNVSKLSPPVKRLLSWKFYCFPLSWTISSLSYQSLWKTLRIYVGINNKCNTYAEYHNLRRKNMQNHNKYVYRHDYSLKVFATITTLRHLFLTWNVSLQSSNPRIFKFFSTASIHLFLGFL